MCSLEFSCSIFVLIGCAQMKRRSCVNSRYLTLGNKGFGYHRVIAGHFVCFKVKVYVLTYFGLL